MLTTQGRQKVTTDSLLALLSMVKLHPKNFFEIVLTDLHETVACFEVTDPGQAWLLVYRPV